uniref:ATP synthase F0 subunit 8 n=1 Tax=Rubricatochromis lifalili TaxID=3035823 RepID=UPI00300158EE|nr:ATP synthase F0 subunit 8 [Rubricatochromis lifalili]
MPQLNLSPWFTIMIFSWLLFSAAIPPKLIAHAFPDHPAFQLPGGAEPLHWAWPWF